MASEEEKQTEAKGFTVQDRRRFSPDTGEARSAFVISLSTQALMHLGEIANPMSGKVEIDVPVAKQMIDIVAMLKDKTRGNVNASEDRLMEDILFDLRMKYVEAVKKR